MNINILKRAIKSVELAHPAADITKIDIKQHQENEGNCYDIIFREGVKNLDYAICLVDDFEKMTEVEFCTYLENKYPNYSVLKCDKPNTTVKQWCAWKDGTDDIQADTLYQLMEKLVDVFGY